MTWYFAAIGLCVVIGVIAESIWQEWRARL